MKKRLLDILDGRWLNPHLALATVLALAGAETCPPPPVDDGGSIGDDGGSIGDDGSSIGDDGGGSGDDGGGSGGGGGGGSGGGDAGPTPGGDGGPPASDDASPGAGDGGVPALPECTGSLVDVPLTTVETAGVRRTGAPVTVGVPLPAGTLRDPSTLAVVGPDGRRVPASFEATARWGAAPDDGSAHLSFVLVDFLADLAAGDEATYRVVGPCAPLAASARVVSEAGDAIVVDTGAARFTVPTTTLAILSRVELASGEVVVDGPGRIEIDGSTVRGTATAEVVTREGERVEVLLRGELTGSLGARVVLRFYAGEASVRAAIQLENRNSCSGRCEDIGSAGTLTVDDVTWALPTALASGTYRAEGRSGVEVGSFARSVSVYQDSSGTANWNAYRGRAPRLQSGATRRESVVVVDGRTIVGPDQTPGWLDLGGTSRVTLGVRDFWQTFPVAVRAEGGAVEYGLLPGEFSRDHALRAGEYVRRDVVLRFHGEAEAASRQSALALLEPVVALPPAEWFAETLAAGPMGPSLAGVLDDYETYLRAQLEPGPGFDARDIGSDAVASSVFDTLERFDVYGYLDYGDLPTDFEVGYSPFNLKYDVLRGMIVQSIATRDVRWWSLASAAARHYAAVDVQHAPRRGLTADRAWHEGGGYGHMYHDEPGTMNPHRNYSHPHPMAQFSTPGLFFYAAMTGDRLVLDAALELSENTYWRIRNSEHQAACRSLIATCRSGSCRGWSDWETAPDCRVVSNAIKTFVWAYRMTGEEDYLDIVSDGAAYQACWDARVARAGDWCERMHFQAIWMRELGDYLLLLRALGRPTDPEADAVLRAHLDYMETRVGRDGRVEMCFDGVPTMVQGDWSLVIADALAYRAILDGDWASYDSVAMRIASWGAANPFYAGCDIHYNYAKELVNVVGFGSVLRYASWLRPAGS